MTMSVNNIIVFIIFVSLLAPEAVLTDHTGFTLDQYLGVWYTVGATLSIRLMGNISCDWTNITKGKYGDGSYNEISMTIMNGNFENNMGHGRVVNSAIYVVYPRHGNVEYNFTVTSYNDDREIILHSKNDKKYHILLSRKSTASAKARNALENHAADGGYYTNYILHDNKCLYVDN